MEKGLTYIITGNGKGKTTCAVGLACRAVSRGLNVCFIQFHKDPKKWGDGETKILRKLGVDVKLFAKCHNGFTKKQKPEEIRNECLKGLKFVQKVYGKNKYDLLVLDEINICVRDGYLEHKEVKALIDTKPEPLNLVLTGRGARKSIIKYADLVSEIKDVKHPFAKGKLAVKGIDF